MNTRVTHADYNTYVEEVCSLLEKTLARKIAPGDDMKQFSLDSMQILMIANALEKKFGHRPSVNSFFQMTNAKSIAYYYSNYGQQTAQSKGRNSAELSVVDTISGSESENLGRESERNYEVIPLPEQYSAAIERVGSVREFMDKAVSKQQIYDLLGVLNENTFGKRLYPSASNSYCVQIFVIHCENTSTDSAGILYQYNNFDGTLVRLKCANIATVLSSTPQNTKIVELAGLTIILTGSVDEMPEHYADVRRDFLLIEAGTIMQVLRQRATECALGGCIIGVIDQKQFLSHIHNSNQNNEVFATMCLGCI